MGIIKIVGFGVEAQCDNAEQAAALFRLIGQAMGEVPPPPQASLVDAEPPRRARTREAAPVAASAPQGAPARGAVKAAVLEAVRTNPEPDMGTLARKLYGADDSTARNKVRICINRLVMNGELKKHPSGGWKVV